MSTTVDTAVATITVQRGRGPGAEDTGVGRATRTCSARRGLGSTYAADEFLVQVLRPISAPKRALATEPGTTPRKDQPIECAGRRRGRLFCDLRAEEFTLGVSHSVPTTISVTVRLRILRAELGRSRTRFPLLCGPDDNADLVYLTGSLDPTYDCPGHDPHSRARIPARVLCSLDSKSKQAAQGRTVTQTAAMGYKVRPVFALGARYVLHRFPAHALMEHFACGSYIWTLNSKSRPRRYRLDLPRAPNGSEYVPNLSSLHVFAGSAELWVVETARTVIPTWKRLLERHDFGELEQLPSKRL